MTKTLTEQWREGTLPCGAYYVNRLNEIRIYLVTYENEKNTHEIYEVLAPVPSYDEYKRLVSKTDKSEKQLAIATKALEKYANSPVGSKYRLTGITACIALKEMEGVK